MLSPSRCEQEAVWAQERACSLKWSILCRVVEYRNLAGDGGGQGLCAHRAEATALLGVSSAQASLTVLALLCHHGCDARREGVTSDPSYPCLEVQGPMP